METIETKWSSYQQAVFAEVRDGTGHLVVEALAGSGKTTTIVQAMTAVAVGLRVLFCAFNKRIATELEKRVPRGVDVKTLHSLGYAAVQAAWGRVKVDAKREGNLLFAAGRARDVVLKGAARSACLKLVAWCKNTLQEPTETVAWQCGAAALVNGDLPDVLALAADVLAASKRRDGSVSFDDMVWLPATLGFPPRTYDVVFVDETQDLNPTQIELALAACAKGGRIIAVGDRNQAIYAFRGASLGTVPALIERLGAKTLPLSICYRCPRTVITEAQRYVPAIECADGAADGTVTVAGNVALDKAVPGDFVLSRTNAPLLPLALSYLRRGVPAVVAGKDIGQTLKGRVEKAVAAVGDRVADVLAWLDRWAQDETAKAIRREDEAAAEQVQDILETLDALCDGAELAGEVVRRIEVLFADVDRVDGRVTLSTVHKAKGLEARRVFVLADTLRPDRGAEERNIAYVAVTRAQHELVYVTASIKDAEAGSAAVAS